jgi:hypothetical protein
VRLLSLILLCSFGCGIQLDPTSFGQLEMTGDESTNTSLEGLSLGRVSGTNAPACSLRLFRALEVNGGDNVFVRIEIPVGKLAQFPSGTIDQSPSSDPAVKISFGFHRDNGFKEGDDNYRTVSGTANVTVFDAAKLVGSFDVTGDRECLDMNKDLCTSRAMGTFDVMNDGCVPPL